MEEPEDWSKTAEVVNGAQLGLSVKVMKDGNPTLVIHFRNAGSKTGEWGHVVISD